MLSTSQIILGCSPPSTYCYSGAVWVHAQYITDHPGILTTLYLLLLQSTPSSYSYVHPRIILGAHHPLPMCCYSKFITGQHTNSGRSLVSDPGIIPALCCMSEYWPECQSNGQHINSGGSLDTDPGIIPGLASMSE